MSGAMELIDRAKVYVMKKFREKAVSIGANAVLGVEFELFEHAAGKGDFPLFDRAVAELGSGDFERGKKLLRHTARMLKSDDYSQVADEEKYAAEISRLASRKGGVFSPQLREDFAVATAITRPTQVAEGGDGEMVVREYSRRVSMNKLREASAELSAMLLADISRTYGD